MSIGVMKLLFVLLSDERIINYTYREIAELAGISLGMVGKGFEYLADKNGIGRGVMAAALPARVSCTRYGSRNMRLFYAPGLKVCAWQEIFPGRTSRCNRESAGLETWRAMNLATVICTRKP
jgi:hypothetical protein